MNKTTKPEWTELKLKRLANRHVKIAGLTGKVKVEVHDHDGFFSRSFDRRCLQKEVTVSVMKVGEGKDLVVREMKHAIDMLQTRNLTSQERSCNVCINVSVFEYAE